MLSLVQLGLLSGEVKELVIDEEPEEVVRTLEVLPDVGLSHCHWSSSIETLSRLTFILFIYRGLFF